MRRGFNTRYRNKNNRPHVQILLRKEYRYRLSQLLIEAEFVQAVQEAEKAWQQGTIDDEDFEFVREVVRCAGIPEEELPPPARHRPPIDIERSFDICPS